MTPQVSILMPAYNAGRFVEAAARSILGQTFRDFEFIVIDDGSTDDTAATLRRLAVGDPRLRLISRPNTGYTPALREAIELARAPLIARMDADDVSMPERLALQVARMKSDPEVVLLGGAFEFIDEDDRIIHCFTPPDDHARLDADAMRGGNPFCHPLVIFRREAYDRVGGYDATFEPAEDLDLWLRLAEVGRVGALPQLLLRYRQHAGSISERRQARQLERTRAACEAAAMRRGLGPSKIEPAAWRPDGTRTGLYAQYCRFGWWTFGTGSRSGAMHYAWKAIRVLPHRTEAWRLLACAFANRRPRAG